jgi:hypothetical protein
MSHRFGADPLELTASYACGSGRPQYVRRFSISALFLVLALHTRTRPPTGPPSAARPWAIRSPSPPTCPYRFIPSLSRDFNTTLDAQRARGYEVEPCSAFCGAGYSRVARRYPGYMKRQSSGRRHSNAKDRALRPAQTHLYSEIDLPLVRLRSDSPSACCSYSLAGTNHLRPRRILVPQWLV